jgi:hypothetical protein
LSFAIVDFSADDLHTKVNKVLRLAFYEALGIDSFSNVQAFGKRRQIDVEDSAKLDQ